MRWKQIDKFESSVKAYGEAKSTWRRKFTAKEGEIEGLKVGVFMSVFDFTLTLIDTLILICKGHQRRINLATSDIPTTNPRRLPRNKDAPFPRSKC